MKIVKLFIALSCLFFAITTTGFAEAQKSHELAKPGLLSSEGFYTGLREQSPEEIHQLLPGTKGKAVFVEFRSKFCYACKQMDPLLEELLPKYPLIEKRVFDMVKDKPKHPKVFEAFQPNVVPIQLYVNTQGEVVNVFYDFHDKDQLKASLDCINPGADGSGCTQLQVLLKQSDNGWGNAIEEHFNSSLKTGSLLTIFFAFLAGMISSFFPCTVAMLPVLVGYMGAYSEGSKREIALQVIVFTLGLASVMTALGIGLSLLGKTFGSQSNPIIYIGIGVLCIVMALQMLEIIRLPLPQTIRSLPETKSGKLTSFYILGCAFGLVASPCGTPVLAAILGIISKEGNVILGGVSLFAYAMGQSVLLIIVGLSTGLLKHRATLFSIGAFLNKLSAAVLILVGLWFALQGLGIIK